MEHVVDVIRLMSQLISNVSVLITQLKQDADYYATNQLDLLEQNNIEKTITLQLISDTIHAMERHCGAGNYPLEASLFVYAQTLDNQSNRVLSALLTTLNVLLIEYSRQMRINQAVVDVNLQDATARFNLITQRSGSEERLLGLYNQAGIVSGC